MEAIGTTLVLCTEAQNRPGWNPRRWCLRQTTKITKQPQEPARRDTLTPPRSTALCLLSAADTIPYLPLKMGIKQEKQIAHAYIYDQLLKNYHEAEGHDSMLMYLQRACLLLTTGRHPRCHRPSQLHNPVVHSNMSTAQTPSTIDIANTKMGDFFCTF